MAYQCRNCNSYTADSQVHSCVYDKLDALYEQLAKADEIILDIHAQITTFSKYTASKVYEWKDIRGKDASDILKEFDDNGRDE